MNEACRYWHAVYSAATIAVGMGTTVPVGATTFMPTKTQNTLTDSKFKLEAPTNLTGKTD